MRDLTPFCPVEDGRGPETVQRWWIKEEQKPLAKRSSCYLRGRRAQENLTHLVGSSNFDGLFDHCLRLSADGGYAGFKPPCCFILNRGSLIFYLWNAKLKFIPFVNKTANRKIWRSEFSALRMVDAMVGRKGAPHDEKRRCEVDIREGEKLFQPRV